jgi:hypothetical protein
MTEKIQIVGTSDIDNQPIIGQEQSTINKEGNLVPSVLLPTNNPGVSAVQLDGKEITRSAVFDIGSQTEYIHIDGANKLIETNNFVSGTSGWQIKGNGDAEFANGTFRGTVTANAGTIGGFNIGSSYIRDTANSFGLSSTVTGGNDPRFWAGTTLANIATAPVRIYEDGSLVATNINATGSIYATSGWIGSPTALVYESQGINTGTTGFVRGGQTSYNTGTGYFIGYDSGSYKLSLGNAASGQYLAWDGSQLVVNDSVLSNNDKFGDGSDGDVTISVDTTITSDMYYDNLTIQTGKTLNPNGFRIFVKNALTFEGTGKIASNGGNGGNGGNGAASPTYLGGTAGTAGVAAHSSGSLPASLAGKAGASGPNGSGGAACGGGAIAGTNGDAAVKAIVGPGGNGGAGGNDELADCGGAGIGGVAGSVTGTIFNVIRNAISAYLLMDFLPTTTMFSIGSGAGSGGAGGSARNNGAGGGGGGGSGASGGLVWVAARRVITVAGNNYMEAKAGNGGNGGNGATGVTNSSGGGGGGGGGCGGVVILTYSYKTGTGTISVAGGTKGTKGLGGTGASNGSDGTDGTTGVSILLQI